MRQLSKAFHTRTEDAMGVVDTVCHLDFLPS